MESLLILPKTLVIAYKIDQVLHDRPPSPAPPSFRSENTS